MEQEKTLLKATILLGVFCFLAALVTFPSFHCKTFHPSVWFSSDLYCAENYWDDGYSNVSYGTHWDVSSHEQEMINSENKRIAYENYLKEEKEKQECYNNGSDFQDSFNISYYGFSCKQIAYINDHLIDNYNQVSGGYISGRYSGFLSYGSISGKFYNYINERILATGKLVKEISYHIDCNGNKLNEQISYYAEEEFVMYYVEECIK